MEQILFFALIYSATTILIGNGFNIDQPCNRDRDCLSSIYFCNFTIGKTIIPLSEKMANNARKSGICSIRVAHRKETKLPTTVKISNILLKKHYRQYMQVEQSKACKENDDCGFREKCRKKLGHCRCVTGFAYNAEMSCEDIDECAIEDSEVCPDTSYSCINTVGSFQCIKYKKLEECGEGVSCGMNQICVEDENKGKHCQCDPEFEKIFKSCESHAPCSSAVSVVCSSQTAQCYHDQSNTITCICKNNYVPDVLTCIPKKEGAILPVTNVISPKCEEKTVDCSDHFPCTIETASDTDSEKEQVCTCPEGYLKLFNQKICVDDNECSSQMHEKKYCKENEICVNTIGSYTCKCKDGYRRNDKVCELDTLNQCKDQTNGQLCGENETCKQVDSTFICICNEGFTKSEKGDRKCEDVDECSTQPGICGDVELTRCVNIDGSYECSCKDGFINVSEIGIKLDCKPIENCSKNAKECGENSLCQDIGLTDFMCYCFSGYKHTDPNNSKSPCIDIDECRDKNVCQNGDCTNKISGFECECHDGFKYDSDSNNCISPEVQLDVECKDGYILDPVENNCKDIDECSQNPDICGLTATCSNLEGSYSCNCNDGYIHDSISKLCLDIDECQAGNICTKGTCTNTQPGFNCECGPGFIYDSSSQDCTITCENGANQCGPNSNCRLIDGTISCSCLAGYEPIDNSNLATGCRDVDECSNREDGPCDTNSECVNIMGSHRCECKEGFVKNGINDRCTIDQCITDGGGCNINSKCTMENDQVKCVCKEKSNFSDENGESICICMEDSTIIDTNGKVICICKESDFSVNEFGKCVKKKSNDCENIKCLQNEECTMDTETGNNVCTCREGYTKSPISGFCQDFIQCDGEIACPVENENTDDLIRNDQIASMVCGEANDENIRKCICSKDGFAVDFKEKKCKKVDISSCVSDADCESNSECVIRIEDSKHCQCKEGYMDFENKCVEIGCNGKQIFCIDQQECVYDSLQMHYICQCPEETFLIGEKCRGLNECYLYPELCQNGTSCIDHLENSKQIFTCSCVSNQFDEINQCMDKIIGKNSNAIMLYSLAAVGVILFSIASISIMVVLYKRHFISNVNSDNHVRGHINWNP